MMYVRSAVVAAAFAVSMSSVVRAAPLDPNAYAALGTLSVTGTSLTVDTSTSGAPRMIAANGSVAFTGQYVSQGAGLPQIAVFTFNSVTLGANASIVAVAARNDGASLAILSRGDISVASTGFISVAGSTTSLGAGGYTTGPGAGGDSNVSGGGGGFGGVGGSGGMNVRNQAGGVGGVGYGDLATALQGGSSGGTLNGSTGRPGRAGGGLEIGAIGTLNLAGGATLNATGGDADTGNGGGSAGGLLVHAATLNTSGAQLLAPGGAGGSGSIGGGGGGGGRVLVTTAGTYVANASSIAAANVSGGAGGTASVAGTEGVSGATGVARLAVGATIVPAGQVFAFAAAGYTDFVTTDLTVATGGVAAKSGAYANAGTVTVGTGGVFAATGAIDGGNFALSGGTIAAPAGLAVNAGRTLGGIGTVSGPVASSGTVAVAGGTLTIGDANRADGVALAGAFNVNATPTSPATLVLLDADRAVVGNGTIAAGGALRSPNGTSLSSGATITAGAGAVLAGAFTNNGTVSGPTTAGQFVTFTDDVNGAGNYTGNVRFSDGFSPGNSPARVTLETAAFDNTTDLTMELAGTTLGNGAGSQYDQIAASGSIVLDGTLDVVLLNGFVPALGDTFALIQGLNSGTFDAVNLPPLPAGESWLAVQTPVAYTLTVVVPEPGSLAVLAGAGLLAGRRRRR